MLVHVTITREYDVEILENENNEIEKLDKAIDEYLQPMNDLVPQGTHKDGTEWEPLNCCDTWEFD